MQEILTKAMDPLIIVFMVSSLLEAGLGLTVVEIVRAIRNIRLTISGVVASYVLAPLIAVILSRLFSLEEHLKIGLILFSMTAGAEPSPLAVGFAKGNVSFAVGFLAVQLTISVIYVPMLVGLFLPEVQIDRVGMLLKLVVLVGGPICLGLFLKARYERVAERLKPYVKKAALLFLFVFIVVVLILNYERILGVLGSGAIGAAFSFFAATVTIGYLLGGPEKVNRRTLMLLTGLRNSSMALMIASQVFHDPDELIMIIVAAAIMMCTVVPLSLYIGRRTVYVAP
jgi:predicted Na+-dependent transporter